MSQNIEIHEGYSTSKFFKKVVFIEFNKIDSIGTIEAFQHVKGSITPYNIDRPDTSWNEIKLNMQYFDLKKNNSYTKNNIYIHRESNMFYVENFSKRKLILKKTNKEKLNFYRNSALLFLIHKHKEQYFDVNHNNLNVEHMYSDLVLYAQKLLYNDSQDFKSSLLSYRDILLSY